MLLMTELDLLYFFIGALETADTLIIYPNSNTRPSSFLHTNDPILIAVHGDDIIGMPLHEGLFSSLDILPNQNAPSAIINLIFFKQNIWVMQRRK